PSSLLSKLFHKDNGCPFTIWPAMFTSGGTAPSYPTGWEAKKYTSVKFALPNDWNGRIWGRRECDFSSGSTLPSTCLTGGCNGGLLCATAGGTGVPPATLGEWNLQGGDTGSDWFDVSNVDGSNLPMRIDNDAGCPVPECYKDINAVCPAELSVYDTNGYVIGCKTACSANLSGDPSNSPNCCSGSYDTPETCPSSGVEYYSVFNKACPDAYAYAYDESSGSALWTCPSSKQASYTLTFC
ncbi:thaumatin, partial [Leucosporidium creatinivorum]